MESRRKNLKPLKLLALALSSLLIATASAAVYSYMFMEAKVGVKTTGMKFVEGTNPNFTETGGQLLDNNQKVTFSQMNGIAGALVPYPEPVNITNDDPASHLIELVLDSWTGIAGTPLYNITITMYNSTNVQQGASIVLVPGGGTGHITTSGDVIIGPSTTWRVQWLVRWKGNALTTDYVQVYLRVIVKT